MTQQLTLESVQVRAVSIPLKRPIVAAVGTFKEWALLLVDVRTKEGVVGSAYLEPYRPRSIPAIKHSIERAGVEPADGEPGRLHWHKDEYRGNFHHPFGQSGSR